MDDLEDDTSIDIDNVATRAPDDETAEPATQDDDAESAAQDDETDDDQN